VGDIFILFFFQNFVVFACIFWGLTWAGEYFYKQKKHDAKKQFYECGFKVSTDTDIQFNLGFTLLCVFLVLYDLEFTILIPFIFNFNFVSIHTIIGLYAFILLIFLSLLYDWQNNAFN
jgi:NADH:ubiquinone oxidoreductase subunit 3 (subunit A)